MGDAASTVSTDGLCGLPFEIEADRVVFKTTELRSNKYSVDFEDSRDVDPVEAKNLVEGLVSLVTFASATNSLTILVKGCDLHGRQSPQYIGVSYSLRLRRG